MSTMGAVMPHEAGTALRRPRICIIALSAVADDPRVRRQGDAFAAAGWQVVAVGMRGAKSAPPDWPILTYPEPIADANPVEERSAELEPVDGQLAEDKSVPGRLIQDKGSGGGETTGERRSASNATVSDGFYGMPFVSRERSRHRILALLDKRFPWQASSRRICISALYDKYYKMQTLRVRFIQGCYRHYYKMQTLRVRFIQGCYRHYYKLQNMRSGLIRRLYAIYYGAKAARIRALSGIIPAGRIGYAAQLLLVRVRPEKAEPIYWTLQSTINELAELAESVSADIWLANDWNVMPIAARMAKRKGGFYVYDSHEFAAEEYAEKWKWRLWNKPLVCAIERQFIREASVVSAVSAGIAERLDTMYQLRSPSLTIRNTPFYQHSQFRRTGNQVRVLYHGIVAVGRGLEQTIDSVAMWRPEFELTIRGPENPGYSDALRQRIREFGLENRVRLAPPVPMTELVREAREFDIGYFALPAHSRHNEFALPNKFFEYVMAGLALCVSDLPEMARLVQQYRLGVLIKGLSPAEIAGAINGLDRKTIDACKHNGLSAAKELCWERESARMVTAYRQLLPESVSG